jgi:hypothetical protein
VGVLTTVLSCCVSGGGTSAVDARSTSPPTTSADGEDDTGSSRPHAAIATQLATHATAALMRVIVPLWPATRGSIAESYAPAPGAQRSFSDENSARSLGACASTVGFGPTSFQ